MVRGAVACLAQQRLAPARRDLGACIGAQKRIKRVRVAPWLNWIEQPPPKGQVAGSNPAGVTSFKSAQPSDLEQSLELLD